MKKILSILFAFALTLPVCAQVQTNKINNTAMLFDNNSMIKLFNATFVVTNGNLLNKFAFFNGAGLLVGTNVSAGGGGDVFVSSNNTFSATTTNTFLGSLLTSNITIRGVIDQVDSINTNEFDAISLFQTNILINGAIFQNGLVSSNLFSAATNYFSGMIRAPDNSVAHRIGGFSFSANNVFVTGTMNVGAATASIININPTGAIIAGGTGLTVTNNLVVSNNFSVARGTTTIGTNGSAIVFIKTATATLDFPSITSLSTQDLTITVGGATTNDIVNLGRPFNETNLIVTTGFVSAQDTVTVRAYNNQAGAVDPASATYRVEVTRY